MADKVSGELSTIAKGASIIIIGSFASKLITYFYRIFVARYLGPFDYGLVTMGLSVFWLTHGFTKLGFSSGIKRRVSHHLGAGTEEKIPSSMVAALSTVIPWSIVLSSLLFFSSDFLAYNFFSQPEMGKVIRIFAVAIPFRSLHTSLSSLLKGLRKVKYKTVIESFYHSTVILLVTLLLVLTGWGVDGALYAQAFGIISSAVLILLVVEFKVYPFIGKKIDNYKPELKELFKFSLPLIFAGMISKLMGHTDTLLIGFFEASKSAGLYNAAFPTARTLTVVGGAVATMLFPTVSKMYSSGDKKFSEDVAAVALKWIFVGSLPLFGFLTIFGQPTMRLLFGEAYVGASVALAILGGAYMLKNLTTHYSSFIKSEEMNSIILKITGFAFVLNIFLNIWLIPIIGISGAAVATAGATAIKSLTGAVIVYKKFGVNPYRVENYLPGILATVLAGGFVYMVSKMVFEVVPVWALFPAAAAFFLIYGILFLLLGGLDQQDLEVLKKAEESLGLDLGWAKKIVRKVSPS